MEVEHIEIPVCDGSCGGQCESCCYAEMIRETGLDEQEPEILRTARRVRNWAMDSRAETARNGAKFRMPIALFRDLCMAINKAPREGAYLNPHCLKDGKPCNPNGDGGCVSCDRAFSGNNG
jgi:hypothetical protein